MRSSKGLLALYTAIAFSVAGFAMAQGAPPPDNIVDGELYPDGFTPAKIVDGKYPRQYYPNTERLGPKEMRVVALGTGMPNVITKKQKASGWYVELGNGRPTARRSVNRRPWPWTGSPTNVNSGKWEGYTPPPLPKGP